MTPVLIRIERNAGHGAGKPLSKRIAESADSLRFPVLQYGDDVRTGLGAGELRSAQG